MLKLFNPIVNMPKINSVVDSFAYNLIYCTSGGAYRRCWTISPSLALSESPGFNIHKLFSMFENPGGKSKVSTSFRHGLKSPGVHFEAFFWILGLQQAPSQKTKVPVVLPPCFRRKIPIGTVWQELGISPSWWS